MKITDRLQPLARSALAAKCRINARVAALVVLDHQRQEVEAIGRLAAGLRLLVEILLYVGERRVILLLRSDRTNGMTDYPRRGASAAMRARRLRAQAISSSFTVWPMPG